MRRPFRYVRILFCSLFFFNFYLSFANEMAVVAGVIPLVSLCKYDIVYTRMKERVRVDDTIFHRWPFGAIDKFEEGGGFKLWFGLGRLGWLS